jgi:hypothetical protein
LYDAVLDVAGESSEEVIQVFAIEVDKIVGKAVFLLSTRAALAAKIYLWVEHSHRRKASIWAL